MITQNEISSLNLSPTKKDFVQIWNELIEVASKITERWDPTSTNESDPGIVLLKALTGIADKLNYNIDKNILEAFMPTAAQMESMRKLCELVGYDIKYYQSATTKVTIRYTGNTTDLTDDNDEKLPTTGLALPKFTTITNADKDITFVTTNTIPVYITNTTPWTEVSCIEGQISQCESINENNLITLSQLDANNRYYLPEIQIAENGIFVYNAAMTGDATYVDGAPWEQVTNLNTRSVDTRVFKFGYDSFEGRPYLAFPEDIGSLIGDGLFIYFVRTSGLNGNISPRTLEVLEVPTADGWENYSAEQFEVVNVDATTNGANIESISTAYNNFKKTVGTFDTLVTCRDYMNKIYSLMDASNSPYVSNILVTDIRNDINNAITLCSCNEFGILYKETPLTRVESVASSIRTEGPKEGTYNIYSLIVEQDQDGKTEVPLIDHFDLLLYPFKTFTQVSSGTKDLVEPYNKSFTYTEQMNREIDAALAEFKTCAHNLTTPTDGDIISINNYLRLNALIATSTKVSEIEANSILQNVKVALVNEFNLRNLDFGEEIPFDSILSVIENADTRIKVVSLQEPTVLTTYSIKEHTSNGVTSKEYGIASTDPKDRISGVTYDDNPETKVDEAAIAKEIYNKLVVRNILAGRASLFNYDETFISNNSEQPYTVTQKFTSEAIDISDFNDPGEYVLPQKGPNKGTVTLRVTPAADTPSTMSTPAVVKELYETYTPLSNSIIDNVTRVEATCEISSSSNTFKNIKLDKNEVIKFRAPNLITTQTFPAYVYYRYEKKKSSDSSTDGSGTNDGSYAKVKSLTSFINDVTVTNFFTKLWELAGSGKKTFTAKKQGNDPVINGTSELENVFSTAIAVISDKNINAENGSNIYTASGTLLTDIENYFTNEANKNSIITFSYYPLNNGTMATWAKCVKFFNETLPSDTTLWRLSQTSSYPKGKLVIETGQKLFAQSGEYLASSRVGDVTYICTDLGSDPKFNTIAENSDVELEDGDKLYIHYTPSSTNEDGETVNAEPISKIFTGGDLEEPVILKPSGFTLIPSEDVNRQGTSYKKFVKFPGESEEKGLLALAPNEQIEMRSISRVVLDSPARFYKNFNNVEIEQVNVDGVTEYELKDGEYIFYTNQNTQEAAYYGSGSVITLEGGANIPRAAETVEVSQILEQGLHIVPWSDIKLLNSNRRIIITEYQYQTLVAGDTLDTLVIQATESTNATVTPGTTESTENLDTPEAAAIADGTSETTNNVDSSESTDRVVEAAAYTLGNAKWLKCDFSSPITYTSAGSDTSTTLPMIALNKATSLSTTWEVCSFLELSTSPGYAQQLRASETSFELNGESNSVSITDKITIYTGTGTGEKPFITIQPMQSDVPDVESPSYEPISIKLSTIAQTASGNFTHTNDEDLDSASVQMKIFKEVAPAKLELDDIDDNITPISNKHSVSVEASSANINNYWSKIDITSELWRSYTAKSEDGGESLEHKPNALSLNFMIPDTDVFGIFSIYLEIPKDKLDPYHSKQNIPMDGSRVFIDIPKEFIAAGESYKDVISNFNYAEPNKGEYAWWSEGVDTDTSNRLYLRAGLNCIKVSKSCTLLVKAQENAAGSILYDNLRLVKGRNTHGINLVLLDPNATYNVETKKAEKTDEEKAKLANEILARFAELDKNNEFYYNVPIENSLAIEFDNNISSFSNPYVLYDINNVNNNFVVSKLDIEYLTRESDPGLRIAKSSRSSGLSRS